MKFYLLPLLIALTAFNVKAQDKDTWGKAPVASDDRFTNPKKPLYAGPNGYWNTGEIRVNNMPNYSFRSGFQEISVGYALVNSQNLLTLFLSFEEETPTVGIYTVAEKGDVKNKKIHISFSDISNKQIKDWRATSGVVEITKLHGFLYFKARNIECKATGIHNKNSVPITLGFEGAIKLEN